MRIGGRHISPPFESVVNMIRREGSWRWMEGVEVRVWNREIFKENGRVRNNERKRDWEALYNNQHERLLPLAVVARGETNVVRSFQGKGVFSIKLCVFVVSLLVDVIYSKHADRTCGPEDAICTRRCGYALWSAAIQYSAVDAQTYGITPERRLAHKYLGETKRPPHTPPKGLYYSSTALLWQRCRSPVHPRLQISLQGQLGRARL